MKRSEWSYFQFSKNLESTEFLKGYMKDREKIRDKNSTVCVLSSGKDEIGYNYSGFEEKIRISHYTVNSKVFIDIQVEMP